MFVFATHQPQYDWSLVLQKFYRPIGHPHHRPNISNLMLAVMIQQTYYVQIPEWPNYKDLLDVYVVLKSEIT